MPQETFVDSSLQHGHSSARWRERLPTILGVTIVVSFVIYHLGIALMTSPDPLASIDVRMYRLGSGGYWVDPQSLSGLARIVSIGAGVNWILTIALVLIVIFWEKRPLAPIGLRMPVAGDLLPALGALVAFHLIAFARNSLGSIPSQQTFAAIYALPWVVRLWVLTQLICEEVMFRGYFIERVEELIGNTWIAAILSCVLFGLNHASGRGFGAVFVDAAVATAYATLYICRRNLPACMVVHFITDTPLLWLPLAPSIWLPHLVRLL